MARLWNRGDNMNDLLLKNNNQAIIRRLIRKMYQANRRRNFFLIGAIILTSFLLTAVFSMGMGYMESVRMRTLRMAGSVSHMAFPAPTKEQLDKIEQLDYVKHVGLGYMIGECEETLSIGARLQLAHVNETQWETMFLPVFTQVEGNFPKNEYDIALSRFILSEMGIEQPYIGMKIPLTFVVYGTEKSVTEVFELCGIYTEYSHLMPGTSLVGYTSYAMAEKYRMISTEQTCVNIIFTHERNMDEQIKKLSNDLRLSDSQQCIISPAYIKQEMDSTVWVALACVVMVLMIAGYLLIYNVMHISIINDIQLYGMLKTVGATVRQIKYLVMGQLMTLCLVGIPIGMIAGAIVSLWMVPAIIVNSGIQTGVKISFSAVIYIGTALFTGLTVYVGSVEPVYLASKISPIEARKYTGADDKIKACFLKKGSKQLQMAVRNMMRQKRRVSIVIVSLSMGMILFTMMTTILASWDIDKKVLKEYEHDISLTASGIQGHKYLEQDFIDKISAIQGIEEIQIRTLTGGELEYDDALDAYMDYIYDKYVELGIEVKKDTLKEKGLGFGIRGIDLSQIQRLCEEQGIKIENESWLQGQSCFIFAGEESKKVLEKSFAEGTNINLLIEGADKKMPMTIAGYIELSHPLTNFIVSYGELEIVVANEFLREKGIPTEITDVGIFIEEGLDEAVNMRVKQMLTSKQLVVSRLEAKRECEQNKMLLYIMGDSISGILALTGICNFIHVISVGIVTRKQELAVLECIGMSKKEVKQMVTYEGLGYACMAIFFSVTIGNGFTYQMFIAFQKIEQTAEFTYPYVAIGLLYSVIVCICVAVPSIVLDKENKRSLVERMRET